MGAARMQLETGTHPAQLKDMVTSPAGTTIAALHALEKGGLRATLIDAVEAATERARQLGVMAGKAGK
jgi:pyrroline-5-carboxylate reductase